MTNHPAQCEPRCETGEGEAINRRCTCDVADVGSLRNALDDLLAVGSEPADPALHAHLFSPYALFVERAALEVMGQVAATLFQVAKNRRYVEHVMQWAPAIARHDPGSPGGILGLDFHLTDAGPRLIEVNTNPGGLLLNALLLDAVRPCAPNAWAPWTSGTQARDAAVSAWLEDARQQNGRVPARLAIVDAAPRQQYLYPEFKLYAEAFRGRGVESVILPPEALTSRPDGLRDANGKVEAVYNRLTDFALADPAHETLKTAYLRRSVALTPHPRAHALFADKRNLTVLGDASLLEAWGVEAAGAERLAQVIPSTVEVVSENRDALWVNRSQYFFKPASGFGSRGSYRGDKLTRRVWDTMASAAYVAQAIAAPGTRIVHGGASLKADVRCFAAESGVLLFAARLYQGQTTNMRTPQGGFAAVLTSPHRGLEQAAEAPAGSNPG